MVFEIASPFDDVPFGRAFNLVFHVLCILALSPGPDFHAENSRMQTAFAAFAAFCGKLNLWFIVLVGNALSLPPRSCSARKTSGGS